MLIDKPLDISIEIIGEGSFKSPCGKRFKRKPGLAQALYPFLKKKYETIKKKLLLQ